ncbi:MAG: type II secretion system protein GspD, partial [Desulfobacterales bacterium]|nr:type II secretion system protein GspD [Desulfobacterales bacterium]
MVHSRKLAFSILILVVFYTAFLNFPFTGFAAQALGQTPSEQADPDSQFVSIDFNNVDINVLIKFMSKLTGKNFVVDSRVKGNVTIISPTKISIKNAYKVFESVLDINGFSTVESGTIIKIVPTPKAKSDNIDTRVATGPGKPGTLDDKIVTRIIPLEYASSDALNNLFTPLVAKGSIVLSYR